MARDDSSVRQALRLAEGPVNLLGYETAVTPLAPGGKKKTTRELVDSGPELGQLQEKLFANGATGDPRRVLLVLQGMDTSGKDGVVGHVLGMVAPGGVHVRSFKKPTPEEAAHHFLWRVRRALPAAGVIGVFNRSHYEDVSITRVHGQIDADEWAERIEQINAFEAELAASGTLLVKCFLHISYATQRERLLARLDDKTKQWKFNPADVDERGYWSDYQAIYSQVLSRTSTGAAPWYVVPSDNKWYRNWAVGRLLVETLTEQDLSYPKPDYDVNEQKQRLKPPF